MEPSDLLRNVVQVLERLGLSYLVTGSMATIFFGEPRFTNDIDIVVALPADRVTEFCSAFPPGDFYVSQEAAQASVLHGGQFNILHPESGLKVDIITPLDSPFNRSEFSRAVRRFADQRLDFDAAFASPEDVILKKMDFYREGQSEKHVRDIVGVLKVMGDRVDRNYISKWAGEMGLLDIWDLIGSRVQEP